MSAREAPRVANFVDENMPGEEDSPFIKVTSRRNRKNRTSGLGAESKLPKDRKPGELHKLYPPLEVEEAETRRKLLDAKAELAASHWFQATLDKITLNLVASPKQIICFGIGNFSNCQSSRFQLAFVLLLKSKLNVDKITFHEPILANGEINLLKSFDCDVCPTNVEGKSKVTDDTDAPTLVYLPHCPKQLTNNFLWANWSPNLHNVALICNSFKELIDTTPNRFLEVDAKFIFRIHEICKEFRLSNNFRFTDIFNDTSLHIFPDLPPASDTIWNQHEEPVYSQGSTELITQFETLSLSRS